MFRTENRPHRPAEPLRQALLTGGLAALVKLALAVPFLDRYGWDRDELYFLQASRHLSFGYVDFPFLTAVVGRLTIDVAGPSLAALRMTGVLAGMLATVLVALCVRELGGGRGAQLLASFAFVLSPYGLGIGSIFHPTMFDLLTSVAFCYVALRLLLREDTRLWPLLGLVAGLGLETKGTVAGLLGLFVLGLIAFGPRQGLREPRAWLGLAIAIACLAPYIGWEIAHAWPTLTFLPTQDQATAEATPPLTYIAQQLGFLGAALVLVALGVRELWRDVRLRSLALLAPATSLLFFVEHGRAYYSLPTIALPLAAGAVAASRWWQRRTLRRAWIVTPLVTLQVAVVALTAPLVWPVLPTATMIKLDLWQPSFYKDEIGWPQLVTQTVHAWRTMPAAQRRNGAVLAENYGEAGALDLYGPSLGLPTALSGHLSFQYWHPRKMHERYLLLVGFDNLTPSRICAHTRVVSRVNNSWHIANQEQGEPIATCTLRRTLHQIWSSEIATDHL
jgi:hypothetical protein